MNLHASWPCFTSFLNAIRTQTLMLLLENDPANLSFIVFCKSIINELISSHTRSKPYINHVIWYRYKKNDHFHNNQPSFNDHHSPILLLRIVARRCIQMRSNWRREVWVYIWIANVNDVINKVWKSPTFYTIVADQVQGKTNCDDIDMYTIYVFGRTLWI